MYVYENNYYGGLDAVQMLMRTTLILDEEYIEWAVVVTCIKTILFMLLGSLDCGYKFYAYTLKFGPMLLSHNLMYI